MRADYKKAIKKAVTADFREWGSKLEGPKEINRAIKALSGSSPGKVGLMRKPGGEGKFCESMQDSLELLMDTHIPQGKLVEEEADFTLS